MEFFDYYKVGSILKNLQIQYPDLTFKISNEKEDLQALSALFTKRFGTRVVLEGAYDPIDNRYILAYNDKNECVAATGLRLSRFSNFKGLEITFTCSDENYKGQHLVINMLKELFLEYFNQEAYPQDIFCSCWHLSWKNQPNMCKVMKYLGFRTLYTGRVHYESLYDNNLCSRCLYREKKGCICEEDVYMLDHKDIGLLKYVDKF